MIELIIQLRDGATAVHELKDDLVTIGRDTDNVMIIADGSVSRHHAEIRADGGTHTLRDLDSANGTTVNGEAITEWMPKDGDVVCFGTVQATWVVRPLPPAAIEPESVAAAVRPLPVKRRALVSGVILLVALSASVFLVHRLRQVNGRPPEVVEVDKHKGQMTKTFWDETHQIEAVGNQKGSNISFDEYPKLPTGVFDFRWFDDHAFESFLGKLDTRNKSSNQVAVEIGKLDKSDVDDDLLNYTDELCIQWKCASDQDQYFARLVSALYKQHKDPEHPQSRDDIDALVQQLLKKRNELQTLTAKVIVREASTRALLTARYHAAFK